VKKRSTKTAPASVRPTRRQGQAVGSTDQHKAAVQRLYDLIGKLPTYKQIRIDVQTTIAERTLRSVMIQNSPGSGRAPVKRAGGGFIPMVPAPWQARRNSVPAMLTPGEIGREPLPAEPARRGPVCWRSCSGSPATKARGSRPAACRVAAATAGGRRPPRSLRPRGYRRTNAAARAALSAWSRRSTSGKRTLTAP